MDYEKYWDSFLKKELSFYDIENRKYLKKGYLHFDNRIWFPDFKNKFKRFLLNPNNVSSHSFFPFLKVILETKRIKFNPAIHKRQLKPKERPICYAAHFDALLYSFYSTYLTEKYEEFIKANNLHQSILAYRSLNLCNIDFSKEVFDYIKNKGRCVAIALDIKGFFDNLDHDILKQNWLRIININEPATAARLPKDQFKLYRSVTEFSYVEKSDLLASLSITEKDIAKQKLTRFCSIEDFRDKVKGGANPALKVNKSLGIPQGSPISAVLSNIYMINYDLAIYTLSQKLNFIYRRYCDDIIVVCDESNLDEIKTELYNEILKLKLEIQPEKEEVVHFLQDGGEFRGYSDTTKSKFKNLQYLGFEYNGVNIYIRSSSLSRYHRRLKKGVREAVKRAYGRKSKGGKFFKKRLFDRFTHLGSRNFITYAHRAAETMDQSKTIKQQIARHFNHLTDTISLKTNKHLKKLRRKGIARPIKH